ncbi:MAG TPA: Gfo/Idh/MocA family oxidoreductase [Victivallales bacterium]|nr:Gfo/Idh/MocA family oxidoreductase [Victivallales bacterium]
MKKIRIGIWGLGRGGLGMCASSILKLPEMYDVVAGCDIAQDRIDAAKEIIPSAHFYLNSEDFLKDKDVELVLIATRSVDHCSDAIRALSHGKYVFLEKPFATSYSDAKKLKRVSQKYPGKLFFRLNRRYEPAFNHVMEIISSGVLGEIYEVQMNRHSYQRRSDWQTILKYGGGQLCNWGPHIIDHALCFLDSPVADIWSNLKKIAALGDAEDHVKIIFTGKNGRVVEMEISGGVSIPQNEYIVFGTKGTLTCDGEIGNTIKMKYLDPRQKLSKKKASHGNPSLKAGFSSEEKLKWIEKTMPVAPRNGFHVEYIWEDLFYAIRKGRKYPITIDHGVEIIRIIEAVRKGSQFKSKG